MCTLKNGGLARVAIVFSQLKRLFWNKRIKIRLHFNENCRLTILRFPLLHMREIKLFAKYHTPNELKEITPAIHHVDDTLYYYSLVDT